LYSFADATVPSVHTHTINVSGDSEVPTMTSTLPPIPQVQTPLPTHDGEVPSTTSIAVQTEAGLSNPLVWQGVVSEAFANILSPPLEPLKPPKKRKTKTATARVLTSVEYMQQAEAEEEEKQRKEEDRCARKKAREEKANRKFKGQGKGQGKQHRLSIQPQASEEPPSASTSGQQASVDVLQPVSMPLPRPRRRTAIEALAFIDSVLDRTIRKPL
jgi:hypothetical protein